MDFPCNRRQKDAPVTGPWRKTGLASLEAVIGIFGWLILILAFLWIMQAARKDGIAQAVAAETAASLAADSRIFRLAGMLEAEGGQLAEYESFLPFIADMAGTALIRKTVSERARAHGLDADDFIVLDCRFPLPPGEEQETDKGSETPTSDDVIVLLTYRIRASLPLLGEFQIRVKHRAVERGWVHGEADLRALLRSGAAGVDPDTERNKNLTVYVTRTGIRYHAATCWYLRESCFPMKLGDAVKAGYTRCLVCQGGVPVAPRE